MAIHQRPHRLAQARSSIVTIVVGASRDTIWGGLHCLACGITVSVFRDFL
jgi:hypothetical protein